MVGFEVTPTTASSRMSFSRKPVSSHSRESVSIHTDWPSAESSCSFECVVSVIARPFHRFDLLQPRRVPLAAVELRPEEGADEVEGELAADHLGAEAEHVQVVVLHAVVQRGELVQHPLAQLDAAMVECDRDPHPSLRYGKPPGRSPRWTSGRSGASWGSSCGWMPCARAPR